MANKRGKTYEAPDMRDMIARVARGLARRAEYDLEALSALQDAQRIMHDQLTTAVVNAKAHGRSWTEIGRELGMTRQSAQNRFGAAVAAAEAGE